MIGFIPVGPILEEDLKLSVQAALASPASDGHDVPVAGTVGAFYGDRTVIKLQHRQHERLETALRFERLRRLAGITAPRLLDTGTVPTAGSGEIWWAVLKRMPGAPSPRPTPAQQRALGRQLRRWHTCALPGGLRLDDPGALGVLLGTARFFAPRTYPALSQAFATTCEGMPVTPIHGDLAVGHNALFDGDRLTAVLDPGGVDCGPPMLDLAWALAVDMPHGAQPDPLLDGYNITNTERDHLRALLPLMVARRLVDTTLPGPAQAHTRWVTGWLHHHAPDLLQRIADGIDL